MPVITGFETQGRRKQQILILLDGEPWEKLDAETVVRQGLRQGMALDRAAQERLLAADHAVRARKAAAGYCARGPRTRRELERYLKQRGYSAAATRSALEILSDSGTLDETRSADAVIARRRRGGYGPRRIKDELIQRGIAPAQASARLALSLEGIDLQAECDALARKAAPRYQPLSDPPARRKLAALLLRRGYEPAMVQTALARIGAPDAAEDWPI